MKQDMETGNDIVENEDIQDATIEENMKEEKAQEKEENKEEYEKKEKEVTLDKRNHKLLLALQKYSFWIFSLVLFILGLVGIIILLYYSWDEHVVVSFGWLNQSILVKIFSVMIALGGVSLPIFLYGKKKNKNKAGWVISSLLTMVLAVGMAVFCTFCELHMEGYYNHDYSNLMIEGYPDYFFLIRTSEDCFNNPTYEYYVPITTYRYYYCFTTYSEPSVSVILSENKDGYIISDSFVESEIFVPFDSFYKINENHHLHHHE